MKVDVSPKTGAGIWCAEDQPQCRKGDAPGEKTSESDPEDGLYGMPGSVSIHGLFSLGMDRILDFLLPRTDAGVLVQLLVALAVFALSLWRFWSNPELRLVVVGLGLLVFGLFGVRALH